MKIIAAIFMLIDHIGVLFYPNQPLWRLLGRIAMPLFAYGVASGFAYTSSFNKYMKRMGVFAIVSQLPFLWMFELAFGKTFALNIGFTFLIALGCLWFIKNAEQQAQSIKMGNYVMVSLLLILAEVLHCDYGVYGIGVVYIFYQYGVKRENQLVAYVLFSLFTLIYSLMYGNLLQIYAILAVAFIMLLKNVNFRGLRYFFYIFYPLHMLILVLIKILIS